MKKLWMRKDELQTHSEMNIFFELTQTFDVFIKDIVSTGSGEGFSKEQRQKCEETVI
jgi:hypothetical protein